MSAIIRSFWPQKREVEHQSTSAGLTKASRPAPTSTLGPRVVNPHHVDAVIDIIFIHGLTGGRESTWTAKGAAACWPELFLPNDLPQARIITYGYDADVVNFWSMASQNTVSDHSRKLLTSLANLRDSTKTSTRPLAFIVHSLGGIICQDALLGSRGSADRYTQRILEHTEGILFMGTPHCGSGLAEWAVIGSRYLQYFRQVNQQTLEVLQQKSEVMARIRQDFHTMLRGRERNREKEIKIICFYEELPVWNIGEIVPKDSATLDRYTSIAIHANHMDMTKFSNDQDPDYRNVLSELQRFVQANEQDPEKERPLVCSVTPSSSECSEVQRQSHHGTRSSGSSMKERDQTTMHTDRSPDQTTKVVNTFSGTFHTNGGKMIHGNEINSGGGPITF